MILESLILLIFLSFVWINYRPKNYPPGPLKVPVLGNILNLSKLDKDGLGKLFFKMSKTYGKVFSFDLGSYRAVIVNDYKLIKEAWNNPLLCGRPQFIGLNLRTGGIRRGILFHDGDEWSEQRRFALRQLKEFGFGKRSMESLVMDEVNELIQGLRKDAGKSISTRNRFNAAVLNALWTITTGDRFQHDDPELMELVLNIQKGLSGTGGKNPALFMPWLLKLAPSLTGWATLRDIISVTYDYLCPYTDKLMADYEGGSPQHFSHVFIDEIKKTTNERSSFFGERGQKTLTAVLMDLFQAGAETTSTTLTWLFLYMSVFPEHQKKLQEEIDEVLESKQPTLQDRYRMPYTEAIILETLRLSSMVPLGLFHCAMEDVHWRSYFIPKNTIIIANLYSAHYNPDNWVKPEIFNPERFLNEEKTGIAKQPEGFVAFSTGKRVCLGETLARDELFLFTTAIFQQFDVTWDPDLPKPSLEKQLGAIIAPQNYNYQFTNIPIYVKEITNIVDELRVEENGGERENAGKSRNELQATEIIRKKALEEERNRMKRKFNQIVNGFPQSWGTHVIPQVSKVPLELYIRYNGISSPQTTRHLAISQWST
ncbi:unnamed protein product [Allacma fusca]|uniref:Cytochrome P450 n=1 Tax=Allacma fusca TaxID=39272 RepID=A0A8J2PNJ6_9HEXA|nr:unnamed protein product [Allacma fusca]